MLVLVITRAYDGFSEDTIIISSSWCEHDIRLSSLCLLMKWNEKWLEKELIILYLRVNCELRGSKEGNTSLNLLSMLTTNVMN